jgi:shikimate 5-dehydrogenase
VTSDNKAVSRDLDATVALVEQIRPLLAGKGGAAQGAALAMLLATWLGGHVVIGNPERQAKIREELLSEHVKTVRQLLAAE